MDAPRPTRHYARVQPGDMIANRFRIESVVGAGGMGVVYRATDLATHTPVALKTLLRADTAVDLGRFSREAHLLSQVRHPGVVAYVAHDAGADVPWLAMEWLDGEDLSELVARGPLPLERALGIARDVLGALAHLHEQGIVHRDLKPSNVFLVADGARAKLIDLGIARLGDVDATALTRTGGVLGTPLYMSPEQARGEVADERADVWALGAVLFEMIAGEAPFQAATTLGVLGKILMGEVPRLAARVPTVPAAVDYAVGRALSRDLALRPATARELLALLTAVDAHAATYAAPAARPERRLVFVLFAEPSTSELWQRVLAELGAVGAHVEPVRGGFLVARFGVERSGSSDAHLCARAAASVRRIDPEARTAIALARTSAGEGLDEVLEHGAMLLDAAAPGELIADADTAAVIGPLLKPGDGTLRVREAPSSITPSRDQGALLGRESELSRIEGVCRTVWDERSPSAFVIVGEPGLVPPARSSFRDRSGDGNESASSWIDRTWILDLDLDAYASHEPSGRGSSR